MSLDQMWDRLAQHQPFADERGYGKAWARMCEERTEAAVLAVSAEAALARDLARLMADSWRAWAAAADSWAAAKVVGWVEKAEDKE